MKKILVSQRPCYDKKYKEKFDKVDNKLLDLIIKLNFIPILVPNLDLKTFLKWIKNIEFGGILLSGGGDIGTKETQNRDRVEKYLYNLLIKKKKPIIGICRGMQFISKLNGVRLKKVKHHVRKKHKITTSENKNFIVNSYHNYSISKCPKNFMIVSKSDDDEIESIRHKKLPIYGCMWHPERESNLSQYDKYILKKIYLS